MSQSGARRLIFSLAISADEILRYYQGAASTVRVVAEDGRRVDFPASRLRPFVGPEGVYGRFELEFDSANKFQALKRLS